MCVLLYAHSTKTEQTIKVIVVLYLRKIYEWCLISELHHQAPVISVLKHSMNPLWFVLLRAFCLFLIMNSTIVHPMYFM